MHGDICKPLHIGCVFEQLCIYVQIFKIQKEVCTRLGRVPHGHPAKAYKQILAGGSLPLPLTDRRGGEGLTVDVEELPNVITCKKDEPLPIGDADMDDEDEDDLLRRLRVYVHNCLRSRCANDSGLLAKVRSHSRVSTLDKHALLIDC